MARVKYLKKALGEQINIHEYPNFSVTGSVVGMKKLYYGQNDLLVRCGSWIYNVSNNPNIYTTAR